MATFKQHGMTPPFSPILLAGMAIRPLPTALLQPALNHAMASIHSQHPDVFERLSCLDEPKYLIDPIDLPFVFVLDPDPLLPSLKAVKEEAFEGDDISATIRGPLLKLIELLEGRIDGDSLFFSRDLVIEGDTEAVVALRNAVDGAEIDVLSDVLAALGPFARPVRRLAGGALSLIQKASADMETLRASIIAPVVKRSEAQANRLREMDEKLSTLAKGTRSARVKRT